MTRVLFVVSEDWALVSHRLCLVKEAMNVGYNVAVATRVTSHRRLLETIGAKVYDWRLNRGTLGILSEVASLCNLNAIIQDFSPDVIHAVALKPVLYTGLVTQLRFKGAVVSALGGVGFIFSSSSFKARVLRILVSLILRIVLSGSRRTLILQNQDDVELLCKNRAVSNARIELVRGAGVEIDIFKYYPAHKTPIKVILPARILWDKGIGEFVSAAKRIKTFMPEVKFVLVGDIDKHNPATVTQEQLNEILAEGYVEQVSGTAHSGMPNVYRDATIVCLPSYREGLPKVLLEAASTGRAMVAFDVAGCREVVKSEKTGILVPFGDEEALKDALLELIKDEEKRNAFGLNARKLVEAEFSANLINEKTFEIWANLLD